MQMQRLHFYIHRQMCACSYRLVGLFDKHLALTTQKSRILSLSIDQGKFFVNRRFAPWPSCRYKGSSNAGGRNHGLKLIPQEDSHLIEIEARLLRKAVTRAFIISGVTVRFRPIRV